MPSSQLLDLKVVATNKVYTGVPQEKIRQWAGEGRIAPHDLVRPSGSPSWKEVSDVPQLVALLKRPAAEPAPSKAKPPTPPKVKPSAVPKAKPPSVPQTQTDARWRAPAEASGEGMTLAVDGAPATAARSAAPLDISPTSGRSRRPRRKREIEDAEMDMTPMIDVTFQLLIFFMFANQLANPVPIVVPEAVHGRGVTPDGKQMILIDEQAHYYLGDSTKPENISPSLEALVGEVQGNADQHEQPMEVIINAHKTSKHVDLRLLMDRLDDVDNIGSVMVGVSEKP